MRNRGEPLEVTFLSDSQETCPERRLVLQAYWAEVQADCQSLHSSFVRWRCGTMQPFTTSAVLAVPTPFTASAACTLPLPCLCCQLCRQLFPISHVLAAGRWRGIPRPPFQAADTRGAHHPTQRQLIKAVCLNLPSLPAHTNKLCHPYLWLQFFTNTRALGMAQKHFFCGP